VFTADHFIRDLQQLLYGNPDAARSAARDIAADLAILIELRDGNTPDCEQRVKELSRVLLKLRIPS
jgi:hypothetical protein